ncbi:MAG: hypothetical protein ACRCV5_09030 [Afipia sp.]
MIGGVLVALIANAVIAHTIRNTLGVRHPKTRSLLAAQIGSQVYLRRFRCRGQPAGAQACDTLIVAANGIASRRPNCDTIPSQSVHAALG